jgi:hypothetical protein
MSLSTSGEMTEWNAESHMNCYGLSCQRSSAPWEAPDYRET